MRAGELRHKIAVQEPTETSDSMGGFTESWSNVTGLHNIDAGIWEVKSVEGVEAKGKQAEITHRIRIRYYSGITNKMQIVKNYDSRTFRIVSVLNPDQRNIMLDLMCLERVD